jgi:hypothetical protein
VLRPGLQALNPYLVSHAPPPLRRAFLTLDAVTNAFIKEAQVAA